MPHMEKPRALNIVLNNEQIQSKKELLDHISQETDVLRSDKRAVIYKNVELFFARKYKKLFPTIRFYFPYAASALITYGIFAALHITPFVVDHKTKHMHYKEYLDSFGNHSSEEQYDLFTHKKNEIRYYSEWKISEDGSYYRDVKI